KFGETLDVSRTNADVTLEQLSLSVPVHVLVAASDEVTPEIVDEFVKEKHDTPEAAQDVEAPKDLSNPTDAAFTDSFGSSSE
ncbi:hypothetical protein A2U01_0091322, partial [Trifolium medium]|nr:hypothetical protein [Trifolium medium]